MTVKSAITPSFIGRMALHGARGAPSICLASGAHGLNGFFAAGVHIDADGHDRRLVQHDAFAAHINQRVGRTQIDGEIGGKIVG